MRVLALALLAPFVFTPLAAADIGGEVPGPGECPYPLVGTEGMEGFVAAAIYDVACSGPTEINGAHWQNFYGGAAATTQIGGGITIAFLNVNVSASAPTGVLRGVQYWACPDLSKAEEPQPVGVWSTMRVGHPTCKTVAPRPAFLDAPPPPPCQPAPPLGPPCPPTSGPGVPEPEPVPEPVAPGGNTPDLPKAL